jgi:microcystin-dependent protein
MPDEPVGSVVAFAGEVTDIGGIVEVPAAGSGWLLCNGAAARSAQFPQLFAAIRAAHGNGSDDANPATDFNLPDLRGLFLRGVNGQKGQPFNDPDAGARTANHPGGNSGNLAGSVQPQQVVGHTHAFTERRLEAEGGSGFEGGGTTSNSNQGGGFPRNVTTSAAGGSETRPNNAYVHWIIKARP